MWPPLQRLHVIEERALQAGEALRGEVGGLAFRVPRGDEEDDARRHRDAHEDQKVLRPDLGLVEGVEREAGEDGHQHQ